MTCLFGQSDEHWANGFSVTVPSYGMVSRVGAGKFIPKI
jgi:hypothetical protein